MLIAIGAMLGGTLGVLVLGSVSEMLSLPSYPFNSISLIVGGIVGAVLGGEFMRRNM